MKRGIFLHKWWVLLDPNYNSRIRWLSFFYHTLQKKKEKKWEVWHLLCCEGCRRTGILIEWMEMEIRRIISRRCERHLNILSFVRGRSRVNAKNEPVNNGVLISKDKVKWAFSWHSKSMNLKARHTQDFPKAIPLLYGIFICCLPSFLIFILFWCLGDVTTACSVWRPTYKCIPSVEI